MDKRDAIEELIGMKRRRLHLSEEFYRMIEQGSAAQQLKDALKGIVDELRAEISDEISYGKKLSKVDYNVIREATFSIQAEIEQDKGLFEMVRRNLEQQKCNQAEPA